MDRLGTDYLDLYLIHWPMPAQNTFVDTFKAFAHLHDQGRIRSIGVSNFEPEHLRILVDATGIVPAVNQVELHPLLPQEELREVHAQLGIATEAWAPLGQGSLLDDPTVTAVAERRGKTPAQVLIRWHIQLGNIVIPKSVTPERIVSNFDVFDFELSEQDMASISSLGDGTRLGPDPRTFNCQQAGIGDMTSAAAVPSVTLNDDHTMPVIGLGVGELSDCRDRAVSVGGAGGRLPADRHRLRLRQRGRGRPCDRVVGHASRGAVRHHQAGHRRPGLPVVPGRPGREPGAARPRLRRPLPDPLARG